MLIKWRVNTMKLKNYLKKIFIVITLLYNQPLSAGPLNDYISNDISPLEQKLINIVHSIKDNAFMQENLRSEACLFFTEQKELAIQLKKQFNTMLQDDMKQEYLNHKTNYKTETTQHKAIEHKSLQEIFNEFNINRNAFIEILNNISLNLQFAAQHILPYTIEEFSTPINFAQNTKQNNYYQLLRQIDDPSCAYTNILINILTNDTLFAQINPAHLTFYWNLLLNLENLFGSYEKYLNIPIDDDSQQNPPLFVHIQNP